MSSKTDIIRITREYNGLLASVETSEFYKKKKAGRVNCYRCKSCENLTKTINLDKGVTPFMIECGECGSEATSTFYNTNVAKANEDKKTSFEFYRPTLEECIKLRKNRPLLEHILKGGLVARRIEEEKPSQRQLTFFSKLLIVFGVLILAGLGKLLIKFLQW